MSARLPAGTIKERADGGVWLKPSSTAKEWKQLSAGTGGAGVKSEADKLPELSGSGESELQDVNAGWAEAAERYQLDGHLPPPEVHPQNASVDSEGDIDSKPVILWTSPEGKDRRTYTQRFHWNRFAAIHEAAKSQYASLGDKFGALDALCSGEGAEHAMAAYVHLKTGQPLESVVGMHAQHGHVSREIRPVSTAKVEKGARASLLTQILHASIALRDRTQFFHWNVVGPTFPALHLLFEKQYDALGEAVDDIAERIRALGETVPGCASEERPMPESAEAMLTELAASHSALRKLCEQAVGQAEGDGDAATVDLLGKRCVEHDKAAWMLRATAGLGEDTEGEPVTKGGHTADKHHPDRAHFLLTHAKGHAYTTSLHHKAIADHVHKRKQEGDGPLFRSSVEQATAALKSAGFSPEDARVVEHHNIAEMAADFLSKTPSNVLRKGGVGAARLHLQEASDHIAEHYGHAPAPKGMSYVPPDVAAAYLEDLGAAKHYPTAYAGLRGQSHKQTAQKVVLKAFGSIEGHEARVEAITTRLIRSDKTINKGDPCSLLEVETFLGLPRPTSSPGLEKSSSTKTTEELKSTTPSPNSESSEPLTKELLLDSALEKGESYLARLAPGAGERRARYLYDRETLVTLLGHEASTEAFLPGTRFALAYPSDNGTLVGGYVDIEDRVSRLVTARHTGTGKTFRVNVADLRHLLHVYHATHAPAVQPGVAEMPEMDIEPVVKSHTLLTEDKPSLGLVLSDIGSRKPEHQMVEEIAKEAYLLALRRHNEGDLEFEQMKQITMAMLDRDYSTMLRLCKGSDVGKPGSPGATGAGGSSGASAGAGGTGRHGPQGLPVGSETHRKDGVYKKEGDHQWARVSEHSDHHKTPSSEAEGSHGSATLDGLRARLSKLRTSLKSAAGTKERNRIISEITAIKTRIKKLRLSQRGKSEAAQKAQENLRDMTSALDYLDDPIEQWLVKAQTERLEALDAFIRETDGDYVDFAADLAYASPAVRAQVHQLRLTEGTAALRDRFYLVKAKVR